MLNKCLIVLIVSSYALVKIVLNDCDSFSDFLRIEFFVVVFLVHFSSVSCGSISWLPVSFYAYTLSIVSYRT